MPSSADHCPACGQAVSASHAAHRPQGFWSSIAWIVALEVVLLLAFAGAVVAYINWSSEVAFAEFLAASKMQAAPPSLNAVRVQPCGRDS